MMTMTEQEMRDELEGKSTDGSVNSTFQKNYLVEAGAGAGKSTTMVRRITNLLLQGVCRPEELVVITFTVKATQELIAKLEKELSDKAPTLAQQTHLIQISTIDGLCSRLLATMPFANALGMSKTVENNDDRLGRQFFRRSYRASEEPLRSDAERFHLRYGALEEAFLNCCAHSDCKLDYVPSDDKSIQDIENKSLSAAARIIRSLLLLLWADPNVKPFLDMTDSELWRLAHLQDERFDPGADGLQQLITLFLRLSPDEASSRFFLDGTLYFAEKKRRSDFTEGLKAVMRPAKKKADYYTSLADEIKACKEVQAFVDSEPDYAGWISKDLKTVLDAGKQGTMAQNAFNELRKQSQQSWRSDAHAALNNYKSKLESILWPKTVKDGKEIDDPNGLTALTRQLIHSRVMTRLDALAKAYHEQKISHSVATFHDVKLMARDMLRDNAEARAYFRERFRVFFVDEFQDTDAVQSELFFYLSSDEKDFIPGKWEQCRPRPGSLFLVGDPKQAIYRFRGADIDTYNRVRKCFENGVGEVRQLSFNFRSTKEICDFSKTVFEPLMPKNDACQAPFAEMQAIFPGGYTPRTDEPLSDVFVYQTGSEEDDPQHVAGFIAGMVQDNVPICVWDGKQRKSVVRPAQYGDFLVLTRGRRAVNLYGAALRKLKVPVNITGAQQYLETPPIARLCCWLRWLCEPENDLYLTTLLHDDYGVPYQDMRRLIQRSGIFPLSRVFRQEDGVEKLSALAAALQDDADLLRLCGALDALARVRSRAETQPAMAVIEKLLDGDTVLWPAATQAERRSWYGRTRQFLQRLHAHPQRDFCTLAAAAMQLAEETVENELALQKDTGCVQVMNLHKAKGLEGEIVILAKSGFKKRSAQSHQSNNEQVSRFYMPVLQDGFLLAWNSNWNQMGALEDRFLEAERIRLLYVAATRAKSMLFVNDSKFSFWKSIAKAAGENGRKRMAAALESQEKNGDKAGAAQTKKRLEVIAPFLDGAAMSDALPTKPAQPPQPSQGIQAASAKTPEALERELGDLAQHCAEASRCAVSPSLLEEWPGSFTVYTQLADDVVPDDADDDLGDAEGLRGTHWGTTVHRILELAVRSKSYDAACLARFARQAASEALRDEELSARELGFLGATETVEREALIDSVADAAARAVAFLSDHTHPLRTMIDHADCYPELDFVLSASDGNDPLAAALQPYLEDAENRALDVQGIIDLAIRASDGWIIVDYKTNVRARTETPEEFRARLRKTYAPQLGVYTRVLERTGMPVKELWLCSVARDGELIALELPDGTPPPTPSVRPAPAHVSAQAPALELGWVSDRS